MVADCCGKISLFEKVGNIGSDMFEKNRKVFMIICIVLTSLSWILDIVAMSGSSVDNDTVQNCAWTVQENNGFDIYYGLVRVVYDPTTATAVNYNWEDCSSDACNDCEEAGKNATNCSVLTFILLFFFIGLSVARMKPEWDNATMKCTFIILSLINILIMIIGMGNWDDECADKHISDGGEFIC